MKTTIHPFPARMASDIALNAISDLPEGAIILDPMTGSGTVLREAVSKGYKAVGFDLDPLAVMMSQVWTKPVNLDQLQAAFDRLVSDVKAIKKKKIRLDWIDADKETSDFVDFWFAEPQKNDLRKISYFLKKYQKEGLNKNILNALKLALSRIIITKKVGASLAWDISHSRPHKKRETNDYDVLSGYALSLARLKKQLIFTDITGSSSVKLGDARKLKSINNKSIDAVVTSPPYLNAIDYLRGHKFSLIWFGYTIPEIRKIRAISVGAERGRNDNTNKNVEKIRDHILKKDSLPSAKTKMIERYIEDSLALMSEISRVLKKKGKAVLVVGNSCLANVYIRNSRIFEKAGELHGLKVEDIRIRKLPVSSRYLPIPTGKKEALAKRMKTEHVLTFVKAA